MAEPEIWAATHRFGTVIENVAADRSDHLDFADNALTENTRACYPLETVPHAERDGMDSGLRDVVMLTADAFGVPLIAKLTRAQAMYHFLSGYKARVVPTEKGIGKERQALFELYPRVYAAPSDQFDLRTLLSDR